MDLLTQTVRRATTLMLSVGVLAGFLILTAPAASAEPAARNATFTNCPLIAATCTRYWSVDRTQEFNNEEKGWVLGQYGASVGVAALAAAAATGTVVGTPVGVAAGVGALYNTYKAGEFEVQLSSAASDNRCLIYKFPKGATELGWWASVSPSTNSQCQKANEKDEDLFG